MKNYDDDGEKIKLHHFFNGQMKIKHHDYQQIHQYIHEIVIHLNGNYYIIFENQIVKN